VYMHLWPGCFLGERGRKGQREVNVRCEERQYAPHLRGSGARHVLMADHWCKATSEAVARTCDPFALACLAQDGCDVMLVIRPD